MGRPSRSHPFRCACAGITVAALVAAAALAFAAIRPAPSAAASLGQLHSQLGTQQSRQRSLSASIGSLSHLIGSLDSQITLVRGRESSVAAQLRHDRTQLARVQRQLAAEQIRLTALRRRLSGARTLLGAQLRSGYESTAPDLMTVVLDAHGFNDLLDQLNFLGRAEHEQQSLISVTAGAKRQAAQAATRLATLQRTDRLTARVTAIRARALSGMNALLASRQAALGRARSAQAAALAASRRASAQLRHRITRLKAAQAAAAEAAAARRAAAAAAAAQRAAAASPPAPTATPAPVGSTGPIGPAPTGGWAIPYAIVLCESGGQNLPPNSAGASGYYQIVPGTWRLFGGSGPAAYLAPKAEQDAVATRIWRGGAGASNWVCAGIVGIH